MITEKNGPSWLTDLKDMNHLSVDMVKWNSYRGSLEPEGFVMQYATELFLRKNFLFHSHYSGLSLGKSAPSGIGQFLL